MFRFVLAWACLSGLYLVLVGQTSVDELVAAACTGLAGAILALAVRRSSDQTVHVRRLGWLAPAAGALAAVPRDVALVGARLLSRDPAPGQFRTQRRRQQGHTAGGIEVLAVSFAPNSFVVAPVQDDRLLTHTLVA